MGDTSKQIDPVIKSNRDRWKNRRWMSWGIFFLTAGIAIRMFFWPGAEPLAMIFSAWLTFASGAMAAYFGLSTYDDLKSQVTDRIHGVIPGIVPKKKNDLPDDREPGTTSVVIEEGSKKGK